ncbi:hypothetical protein CEXT_46801, partial [Caerostris extrusa]
MFLGIPLLQSHPLWAGSGTGRNWCSTRSVHSWKATGVKAIPYPAWEQLFNSLPRLQVLWIIELQK